jgi:signal transduction histidine kinase
MALFKVGQWFQKLKVGQKISLGYSLTLGLTIVGTTLGVGLTHYYQYVAQAIEEDSLEEYQLLTRLETDLLQTRSRKHEFIPVLKKPEELKKRYALFLNYYSDFKQVWQEFKNSQGATKSEEEQELPGEVERTREFIEEYTEPTEAYIHQLDKLLQQINLAELKPENINTVRIQIEQFDENPVHSQMDGFLEDLVEIIKFSHREYDSAQTTLETSRKLQLQIIVGTLLFSGLTALVLTIATTQAIARPIQTLTRISQRTIQESNFDLQALIESEDEIGVLASSFNQLITWVKELLQQQQEANEKLELINQNLELTVADRTQELNDKNTYLLEIIKELHHTQIQIIQSEKMSALGQMVAGIAHEINNPVSFVYSNLHYLQEYTKSLIQLIYLYQQYYPNSPQVIQEKIDTIELDFLIEDLDKILQSMTVGTTRIQEIVLSLRNFSRLDEAEFKAVDLHEGIDNSLMILQHRLKAQPRRPLIQVIKKYALLPLIECFAGQLNQVFMNLLSNAIDALEESAVKNKTLSIWITTEVSSENHVLISIADNGSGIAEHIRSRLFDPFFTTKEVGKGTGLGLSISYQIVTEKHGGKIWCESTLGEGTKFMVEIPVNLVSQKVV